VTQAIGPFLFSMILDASGPVIALAAVTIASLAAFGGMMVLRANRPDEAVPSAERA
jgi:hypothetical protein